ncbi:hypothetical protein MYG64_28280 (plasmid) [Ensifer adhaerens]|uniref:hypothetical protein n=1 Tax=Ensifer adhaerens TaxID=106592 RepID=UPI002100D97E|nr:hypothetical protein [Ensifer adhaerens]UTV41075.1 hypothetical protein MYG64_28280 [Ensifer adhaerens]
MSVETERGDGACRRAMSRHTATSRGATLPGRSAQAFEARDGNEMNLVGRTGDEHVGGNSTIATVSTLAAVPSGSAVSGFAEQVFVMARILAAGVSTPGDLAPLK